MSRVPRCSADDADVALPTQFRNSARRGVRPAYGDFRGFGSIGIGPILRGQATSARAGVGPSSRRGIRGSHPDA
jgi:hypothetical protein